MHPTSGGSPRELIGRQDERRRFLELLNSGRKGVVLHGPTGVGKTRLADDLVSLHSGRVERSTELGDQLGGLAAMYALHNRSRVTRDRDGLGEAAEQFAAAGAMAIAAAVAGDAARAAERADDARGAARWVRRAAELSATVQTRNEFVVAPEFEALSRREREVSELAAAGMTSRAISERLFLSVRTVENHLGQAFSKLGVTSRDELAEALA